MDISKIKLRLLSDKMHRCFDVMVRLYCYDMSKSETNIFADLLVKQLNGSYRIGVLESKPKPEVKPEFKTYEYGSKVLWVSIEFFVVEDTGKYNVLIANKLDNHDPEYQDYWIDKKHIKLP